MTTDCATREDTHEIPADLLHECLDRLDFAARTLRQDGRTGAAWLTRDTAQRLRDAINRYESG